MQACRVGIIFRNMAMMSVVYSRYIISGKSDACAALMSFDNDQSWNTHTHTHTHTQRRKDNGRGEQVQEGKSLCVMMGVMSRLLRHGKSMVCV